MLNRPQHSTCPSEISKSTNQKHNSLHNTDTDTTINNQITDHDGRWHRKPTQQSAQQLNQRQRWPMATETNTKNNDDGAGR